MDSYFPDEAKKVFSSSGREMIKEIGLDIIRGVVLDVLCGKNLRDSTELLTRKRILTINAATLVMMLEGSAKEKDFVRNMPEMAYRKLKEKKLEKRERWLMQWILGLTDKAFQNVLRDDKKGLEDYKNNYLEITSKAIEEFQSDYGVLSGNIGLNSKDKAEINWQFLVYLMNTIGAQTLAIRGSDKSTFGKLFEKLILGTLLSLLGFELVKPNDISKPKNVFWLSSTEKRESDATLLYSPGKAVRFDIGFIGRGNPEISLDKVSRFEREIELGRSKWYVNTIIIVDRIGKNSRIEALAKRINGRIVQMSGAYWALEIAKILKSSFGYKNEILDLNRAELGNYLKKKLDTISFENLLDMPIFSEKVDGSGGE